MPPTVTKRPAVSIPPDLAAVLAAAPIHPELARVTMGPLTPTAASLTVAALNFAALAALDPDGPAMSVVDRPLPGGVRGVVHAVGRGGVLHLEAAAVARALSLAYGTLDQRGTMRPRLAPGAVRLVPAGRSVTLADLAGGGALVVEVVCDPR